VRLNDAVAAIPGESWDFVLSEIHRVLCPGGRLELIHDQLCFSSIGPEIAVSCSFANAANGKIAMRDMSLPESKKSPYEEWEAEMRNCSDIERLYLDMLAQRYGIHPLPRAILLDAIRRRFGDGGLINVSNAHVCLPSREFMTRTHASSSPKNSIKSSAKKRDFGISITINWGSERPSKKIGWQPPPAVAPPQQVSGAEYVSLASLPPVLNKKAATLMGVAQLSPAAAPYLPPGLVVVYTSSEGSWHPMTYLPMSPTELDVHSNKHVHSVISAKLALDAHIDELREKGKPSMPHEALDEALWQYAMHVFSLSSLAMIIIFTAHSFAGSDGSDSTGLRWTLLNGNPSSKAMAGLRNKCATAPYLRPKQPMVSHPFGCSKFSRCSRLE